MFSFELVYFASHAEVRLRLKIFENPGGGRSGTANKLLAALIRKD
jgi:hypothetical protein